MKAQEQLEILRVWTVSTQHISHTDATQLSEFGALCVYEYGEGFWIMVPDASELTDDDLLADLRSADFSPAIGNILTIASKSAVEFVRLDADGPVYTFLPQFHW